MTILYDQSIQLVQSGQPTTANSWLVSNWAAGQTSIMNWSANNVTRDSDGSILFKLDRAPAGSSRPFNGAEIQSIAQATTGTFAWTAQAPVMQSGAVFGLFTYKADWQKQPWVEFDFEFVGKDTTKVQLNIHMEDASGRHISLDQAKGGPIIVDLGFDAAKGMHHYEVVVTDTNATFRIDGKVVGVYGAKDMPGGVWQLGPMKSFVDLWAVSPGQESWAGAWNYNGTPLVGDVRAVQVAPGVFDNAVTTMPTPAPAPDLTTGGIVGTAGNDLLSGTDAADRIDGRAGDDTLNGLGGNDTLLGGDGNDVINGGLGDDRIDGGAGIDTVVFAGTVGARVDLNITTAQDTGYGRDIITGVENVTGDSGHNQLRGNAGDNVLRGGGGNDQLWGDAGHDILHGGAGNDILSGGSGNDQMFGGAGNDRLSISEGNDTLDGGDGSDWVFVGSGGNATISLATTAAQATGHGTDVLRNIEHAEGNSGNDRLTGNAGANILSGKGGADTLLGGAGADTLIGGTGRDVLYGGVDTARDVFVFNAVGESPASAPDTVFDFVRGTDVLDLTGIDARPDLAGDQAFAFTGTKAAAFSVWYAVSGKDVMVHADATGDGVSDFGVLVKNLTAIGTGDILL